MIGTATFVMLIAATAIADNAYPPCTQQRTDKCSAQQQAPGPTLYIPCPKGEYCPPHRYPAPQEWGNRTLSQILARMRHNGCGGPAGKAELLTGIEGVSSRPVRRIGLLG